jgi:hypothetical protein
MGHPRDLGQRPGHTEARPVSAPPDWSRGERGAQLRAPSPDQAVSRRSPNVELIGRQSVRPWGVRGVQGWAAEFQQQVNLSAADDPANPWLQEFAASLEQVRFRLAP